MEINENWLRHNKMLRQHSNSELYQAKIQEIQQLYKIALNERELSVKPIFFDSHQASICGIEGLNIILCDVHFFDIATLVASSFYVHPTHDIKRLMNALLADSCICHDDISTALACASKFIDGPYAAVFNMAVEEERRKLLHYSRQQQTSFAILHELAHFECNNSKQINILFRQLISAAVDKHNRIAGIINSLDLQPLIPYLDKIDIQLLWKANLKMADVIEKYGHLVKIDVPDPNERKLVLTYACDNYLLGRSEGILDRDKFIEECTCDLLAMYELLDYQIPGKSGFDSIKQSIESFHLCLLTQNFIETAFKAKKLQNGNDSQYVDEIYMRKRIESEAICALIKLSASSANLSNIDCAELIKHFARVSEVADIMYGEFSEYLVSIDLAENDYIPYSSDEWWAYYFEIERLLQYPV